MTWYTASIVTAIFTDEADQELVPVFEDCFLVMGKDRIEALRKAEIIGREHALIDDGVTLNGKVARREYLGVRKLRSVYNPPPYDIDLHRPVDGTELTHSYFEVGSIDEARALANGKALMVAYVDDDTP